MESGDGPETTAGAGDAREAAPPEDDASTEETHAAEGAIADTRPDAPAIAIARSRDRRRAVSVESAFGR